jgi:hypothetical protein
MRCGLLGLTWAATFTGLRLVVGPASWVNERTPLSFLLDNLSRPNWIGFAAVFFGVLWWIPVLGWREFPRELRRLALLLTPYLVLQFLFGRIREVRLLLPLSIALIPMALLYIRARLGDDPPGETP